MSETAPKPIISEDYRRQQQELHKNPQYGVASIGFAPAVARLIEQLKVTSLSDYGAGKQNLKNAPGGSTNHVPYRNPRGK